MSWYRTGPPCGLGGVARGGRQGRTGQGQGQGWCGGGRGDRALRATGVWQRCRRGQGTGGRRAWKGCGSDVSGVAERLIAAMKREGVGLWGA